MKPQKWQLIKSIDISPSTWFPLEKRTYRLPDGREVNDFYITTLADVAMILPLTLSREVVLIDVYKPGADAVLRQFPAGRLESHHQDIRTLAVHELEEETGINIKPHQLELLGTLTGFSTKATAKVTCFIAQNVSFNSHQKLDEFEDIQVVVLSPQEVDYQIRTGQIWCAQTIAFWYLAHQQGHLLPKP